jgi:regulatory protein
MFKKRTEYEVRNKFANTIEENLLEDIIQYLKDNNYINDNNYIQRFAYEYINLKNLSIKELQYKLISKGLNKNTIEDYIYSNQEMLEEYEIKSAKNIIIKKSNLMELEDIKQYLLKKGYKYENIKEALEGEKNA